MCGIAGAFTYRGTSSDGNRSAVGRACRRMACRGPDGEGSWSTADGRVTLGHRRLAIIDLSERGAQPMVANNGSRAISFNGEIYNYRELRRELEGRGRRFESDSDTEVLLQLYDEYGDRMLARLRGMFAFILWDAQRERMILARDAFGIKPLYFADDGRTITVATQVKALRAAGAAGSELSAAGQVGFYLFGHVPEPFTIFRDIKAVPAGTSIVVERERGAQPARPFDSVSQMLRPASPSKTATREEIHDALLETVRYHLVADVDVGVFLSAGIDSGAIAALAAEAGAKLRTVTLGFDEYAGTDHDETALAATVARHYGAEHQTVRITKREFDASLETFLDQMDQPSIDGLNSFFVAQATRQAGLKVALSGLGGDELFGGYPSFRHIPQMVRATRRVPQHAVVGRALRAASAPLIGRITSPKYASLMEFGGTFGGAYLLRRGLYLPWEIRSLVSHDVAQQGLQDLDVLNELNMDLETMPSDAARVSLLEATSYMRNQLLRDSDWASMAHSLEVRVPLVDAVLWRRLSAAVAAGELTKQDLAGSARPALPSEVTARRKTGFTTPLRRWIAERPEFGATERGYRGWARCVMSRYATF